MYTIQQHEFIELKRLFDQNDPHQGAEYLTLLFNSALSQCLTTDYNGQMDMDSPFKVGNGLKFEQQTAGYEPKLEIDETILTLISELSHSVMGLLEMHEKDGKHIPKIISTREQYEEMKPEMDEKERVLVHTTFDKALNVL